MFRFSQSVWYMKVAAGTPVVTKLLLLQMAASEQKHIADTAVPKMPTTDWLLYGNLCASAKIVHVSVSVRA